MKIEVTQVEARLGWRVLKTGVWVVWELQDYEYISLQGPLVDVGMRRPSFQRAFEEVKCKVDRETLVPLQLQTGLNRSIQGTGPGLKIPGKQTLWGLVVLQE